MRLIKEYKNINQENLSDILGDILVNFPLGSIIGLEGNLGAGKTFFVQSVGMNYGIEESIESPTYILMQEFNTQHPLVKKIRHFDLYRLESDEEFKKRGLENYLKLSDGYVFIEWPEKFSELECDFLIKIEINGENRDYLVYGQ